VKPRELPRVQLRCRDAYTSPHSREASDHSFTQARHQCLQPPQPLFPGMKLGLRVDADDAHATTDMGNLDTLSFIIYRVRRGQLSTLDPVPADTNITLHEHSALR
jgi:hypothetical protein